LTAALSIVDAGVRLGGHEVLHAVNAEIAPGEFIGIFGPNGAGKSTLIRCILGLAPLSAGRISVFGVPAGRANRMIGYMPQSRVSLEGTALSARSMVSGVAAGDGWGLPLSPRTLRAEVDRVIELAGVGHFADRPFSVLSGGERQRVGLAQALLGKPRLLLLDEPLASLDPRNQMLLIDRVTKIKKTTNTTILFTAHDVNPLLGVMDRVLYIAGGEAAIGSLDEVITSEALSHLYKTEIRVIRVEGNIFILAAEGGVIEAARHD
jgi:zinc/manganese transport system ATP-binding protein